MQSLPWNAAAIVVSETMGDATYQVKPEEAVLFKGGHLSEAVRSKQNCGCPAAPSVKVAKAAPLPPVESKPAEPIAESVKPLPAPSPEEHVAVEAPFVFRANDPAPNITELVATLKLESNKLMQLDPVILPPPQTKKSSAQPKTTETATKQQKHGFFSRVGAFLATIFR